MSQPLVSIVMLCWNRKDDVKESLKRIRLQTYSNIEIIVVDNASTDGTVEMVEREFPEVRLLKMFKNIGIEAYNIGFENARGKYIVILDDDSFPREDAVGRMVKKFEADETLGVVAFDVRNYCTSEEIGSGKLENGQGNGENRSEKVENGRKLDSGAVKQDYLMSFNGAGAGVRRDVFKRIGYYPEEFFLYHNEADVAFRMWDAGYKIQFFADIIGFHKYSPKNRSSERAPFFYTRNAFWLIWKNYPLHMAVKATLQLAYDCLYYSVEQSTFVYIKALWSAIKEIHNLKDKRKPVKKEVAKNLRVPFGLSFTFFR